MTTNRPGNIDEAFVSRIHVTIELGHPGFDDQLRIWTMFISELEMSDKRELIQYVTKFELENLNGRQIRNAIRLAVVLATLDDSPVETRHLKKVINAAMHHTLSK